MSQGRDGDPCFRFRIYGNAMVMEPYVGIAIFELADNSENPRPSFFREDWYLVYADSDAEAYSRVEARAREQETPRGTSENKAVILRHIVDVAPALYGKVDEDTDLYSRHFASLEDYKRCEMLLGGKDPLVDDNC